jgi:hypothetical protein
MSGTGINTIDEQLPAVSPQPNDEVLVWQPAQTPSTRKMQIVQLLGTGVASSQPTGPAGGDLGGSYPNPLALKTNGVAFARSATVDATNASNITTGVLPPAQVPALSTMSGAVTYPQMPAEVQLLPIAFPFVGKPTVGTVINIPMAFAVTIAAALAGTVVYAGTKTTSPATFTLNKVSSGTTAIGSITFTSTTNTSATLAGTGGSLGVGDVLQIVAPGTQDATLADLGISVLTKRV